MNNRFVPAEWQQQDCIWTAWPNHVELWPEGLLAQVQQDVANMIAALQRTTTVKVLVCDAAAKRSAQHFLCSSVMLVELAYGDIWLRDTGPVFLSYAQALCFRHNGWGGKYLYPHDDRVAKALCQQNVTAIQAFNFVLEGGAVEHNGEGAILTTKQCLLHQNRNGWSPDVAETALYKAFNAQKIYWLESGLLADHTDGHIDNIARFIAADTVLCQTPYGDDDPNAALYLQIENSLKRQGLNVKTIPSPGKVVDDDGRLMPASYMNYIYSNGQLIVPTYGTGSTELALSALKQVFSGISIVGIQANALLTGGGSFHCITQQQPMKEA